ncbi:MAG: S8 family serine peptidase [Planctomycetota bacterium]
MSARSRSARSAHSPRLRRRARAARPQRVAVPPALADDDAAQESITHTLALPLQGITAQLSKTVDLITGDVVGAAFDSNGERLDVEAALARESALRAETPLAKLHVDLAAAIERDPENAHEVVLWVAYDADALDAEDARLRSELPAEPTPEAVDAMEEAMTAFAMDLVQAAVEPVLAELANIGVDVRYVSTTAPSIFVDASRAQVLAIAASNLVDTLYLEKTDTEHNTSANGTHRANLTYSLGWRGAGIRVAVLEDNGVDPACPHLNVVGWYNPFFPNPDDHVHGTSGCIASQLASRRGGAPSVQLYSANASSYSDLNITRAADWIVTRNIDVTNMSFGGGYSGVLQYKDRYFDFQSRVYSDSYVASAGNNGNFVGSPGTAWNCVTAGSFRDNNNTSWTGDAISAFSDWQNPTTGCEKPNLAAVGEGVDTIGMAPDWLRSNYSGTSFSAPFTSAALAVCMGLNSNPRVAPEAAMAMIMATAWHNIEGATRLSARDGAGGLHQRAAAQCSAQNRVRYVNLSRASFSNNGYYTFNVSLNGGDRARVCIAWSSNANRSYTSTLLNADLDLTVLAGANATSGTSYGSSSSFNNNFEIVEFTPPTTGTYTIRINDYRFNGTTERVGIAWSQRNRDLGN